ncbi:MAG TPA: elongation factor G [Planctomycetota bacterium]|jgi:elongation factor G|nr:elongation factor G [Planctomycetota bacterium]
MPHEVQDIRNLALVGHGDSGKTALVDAVAHLAGVVPRRGSTAEGTSVGDFEPEEKEKKHSLASAIVHVPWKKRVLNWIDCPGYPDFVADANSALAAVETALVAVSSTTGITFNTRQAFAAAGRAGTARALLVTKCDAENTDFDALLVSIAEAFGDRVVPVTFPEGNGPAFRRVVDALGPPADLPAPLRDRAASFRTTLVERLVEAEDALMERYLAEGTVPDADLARVFPKAMARGLVIPLFAVDPVRGIGLEELLTRVVEGFPSPVDFGPRKALLGTEEVEVAPDPAGALAAFVFKTLTDPYVGKISYLRVFRGSRKAEEMLPNPKTGKGDKLAGLGFPVGKEVRPAPRLLPGDIVAVPKIESLDWGNTVHDEGSPVAFPKPPQPKPMVAFAIEPKARQDEAKLSGSLQKLAMEDPTFHVRRDAETKEMCVEGLSDLHLQVMLARLKRRFGVEVTTRLPKVPYRETVSGRSEGHYRHKKQTGGRGQFGECFLRMEPLERGAGFEFVDEIFGGSIPRQFIPAVEKGVREAMERGVIAGYPVVDVRVKLYDGKYHEVDSDEASFKIAGSRGFRDAFEKARPVILEPILNLDVTIPTRFLGDITGDLNSRRGRIVGMESDGTLQTIKAHAPLAELLTYSTQLRSLTAGEGSYSTSFSHYEVLPAHLAEKIIAAHRASRKAEED